MRPSRRRLVGIGGHLDRALHKGLPKSGELGMLGGLEASGERMRTPIGTLVVARFAGEPEPGHGQTLTCDPDPLTARCVTTRAPGV